MSLQSQINSYLDVRDTFTLLNSRYAWSIAKIIDENKTQIKISWYGWQNVYDEWIGKTSPRIKSLNSRTFPITIINHNYSNQFTTPLFFINPSNKQKYIIQMRGSSFHKYDTIKNRYSCIQLPSESNIFTIGDYSNHIPIVNPNDNNTFYIMTRKGFWLFNVNTFKLTQILNQGLKPIQSATNQRFYSFWMDDRLHICSKCHCLIIDIIKQSICNSGSCSSISAGYAPVIYIKSRNKLLVFGEKHSILKADLIKLPFVSRCCSISYLIEIFDCIVIVFVTKPKRCILFYDVNNNKWFKCDKYCDLVQTCNAINTKDNFIHFFKKYCHFRINILDMIPKKMNEYYCDNINNKLIFGFISEIECNDDDCLTYSVPTHLKQLILKYYPPFLYFD